MESSHRNNLSINQTPNCAVQDFTSQLPSGILADIFTRLPIKAIVQCKCVRKTWCKLISDDHFSSNMYTEETPFTHIALMDVSYLLSRVGSSYLLEFEGKVHECNNPSTLVSMKLKSPIEELLPVGSSKGLFCLVEVSLHHDLFYINNPILEQYVVLPKAKRCSYEETCTMGYGFGYSPSTRHFKVIRIVTQLRVGFEALAKAEILTLGHDETWRNLDVSSIQYYFGSCAITLGGTLHWIVGKFVCTPDFKTITNISTDLIVGFDIDEERFRTILLPSALENQKKQMRLTSVGNCLCLGDYNESIFQIDVWRMEDYGVSESWTKTCIISTTWLNEYSVSSAPPMIGISEDDQDTFLISDLNNHCLISYNLKNNSWSKLEVHGTVLYGDFYPFAYDPSFVSMKDVFRGSQLRILQI
ncbi:hypothetical protein RND71_021105 [Anisodus tanguticus]|uniref:F-box domain-containing protein n=1 Tax=Anisodus tanguticus TaxID=243964 RepID=A0AAE1RVX6_9SOLA|nr:hypothetical protein RND71_021105 [Anisodus tanguticus]